jgi:hypothetical protein
MPRCGGGFFGSPEASFVTSQHLGASGGVAML